MVRKEHNKRALQPVPLQARAPQKSPSQGTLQSSPTKKAPQETAEGP